MISWKRLHNALILFSKMLLLVAAASILVASAAAIVILLVFSHWILCGLCFIIWSFVLTVIFYDKES